MFPATPLDVEVSLALSADLSDPGSWSWTDITDYVRENSRIRIRRGRSSERSTIPPSRCTLTVDNTGGRFCRLLPTGAWYGQIGKNTPLRVRVNNGSGYVTRFVGYVSGWPPTWDPSESDQTVTLTADGILRRLGQGRVLRAALERAILADGPAQFWPFTDGTDTTRPASAVAGGVAMSPVAGTLEFATAEGPAGAPGPLLDMSAGSMTASFPTVGGTGYTLEFIAKLTTAADPSDLIYRLRYAGSINTISEDADFIPNDGEWHHYVFAESQVGADVYRERWLDGELEFDFTFTGSTVLHPNGININIEPPFFSPMHIGYMAIHPHAAVDVPTRYQAMLGFLGEQAHERVERLCSEEGIAASVTATESQPMGAQGVNTLVALLRECAATDFGLLYEPADAAGLAYLSSTERYNQAAAITLEYDQGHVSPPWEPTDDDRDTRNDVTASRSGGGSARATDEASIAAVGLYDDSISANTETDDQLGDVAGWAVNLGTVDELRWPAVRPNLVAHPSLIDDWMAADLGSQLHVTGHPSPLAPDDITQVIEGYDETFGSYEYNVVANLSPASGWTVAELDDDDNAKLDTDGSDLNAAVNSSSTTLQVATQTGTSPLWTTDGGEMPIPLIVAGEVMSATAVAAPTTITYGAVGTATHASNASVTPGIPASVAAGNLLVVLAAIRNSGTGVPDTPSGYTRLPVFADTDNVQLFAKVAVGGDSAPAITFTGGVANATCSAQMIRIAGAFSAADECFVSGQALLNSSAQDIAYPGLPLEEPVMATAIHNAIVIYVGWKQDDWTSVAAISGATEIAEASSTTGDDQALVWDYAIQTTATDIREGSFTVTGGGAAISRGAVFAVRSNVQAFTVTRSVNGVVKSQTAGTAVNVHKPWRFAL